MILGVDVGGTFTDLVLLDDAGELHVHKLLTSIHDPSQAILQGIADLGAGPETAVVHGATVATNALLERRGARTALVTTEGFGDVLEIGRQTRSDLYALLPSRPPPLVPAKWRFELRERVAPSRRLTNVSVEAGYLVLRPLEADSVDELVHRILIEGIESVAVCFLFSFLFPAHEQRVRERIQALGGPSAPMVSLSSEVLPEYREYERTSTVVINAYVAPLMSRYLSSLEAGLGGRRLRIMQSNGGSISPTGACALAARTALSGPAGGVVGAFELARRVGLDQVITFDMGGTSTDVSLCPGSIRETTEGSIAGLPLRLPMLDIHTVGAGGGSIATLDHGGALHVGPESAGAEPGPVCYGRSEAAELTVTDANLVLGRLDAGHFLGGRMTLDVELCRRRMQAFARRLSLPLEAAAWGIVRVANSNMERAIRAISIERGYDPRGFVLVAFGGAGPLHACELAAALHIPRVLIPPHPGVLSALGMVLADVVKDYSRTVMLPAQQADCAALGRLFAPLREHALIDLHAEGVAYADILLLPALDMRYVGQSFELAVPLPGGMGVLEEIGREPRLSALIAEQFHTAHERRFTYANWDEPVEIVTLRLKAIGRTRKPTFYQLTKGSTDPSAAHVGYKQVHFSDPEVRDVTRPFLCALYERERLLCGNIVVGPAVVFQLDSTIVLPPGWAANIDEWGNLVARWRGS